MLIKLVRADCLNQILNCALNLLVFRLQLLGLISNPSLLHLNEIIKSEGLSILRKVYQDGLGKGLQVVLDSVFHDIIDVNDQLLELG